MTGRDLEEPAAEVEVEDTPAGQGGGPREWLRMIACVLGIIATAMIAMMVLNDAGAATDEMDASAVQIIQIYAEGVFLESLVLGAMIAVYIGTRAGE